MIDFFLPKLALSIKKKVTIDAGISPKYAKKKIIYSFLLFNKRNGKIKE
jgi:hypothetical protein